MNQDNKLPLWRVLNFKRTQGEWKETLCRLAPEEPIFGFRINVEGKAHIAYNSIYTDRMQILPEEQITKMQKIDAFLLTQGNTEVSTEVMPIGDKEAEANAEYTALCVNNFQLVVEALQKLYNAIDSCIELTPEVLKQAQSALARSANKTKIK